MVRLRPQKYTIQDNYVKIILNLTTGNTVKTEMEKKDRSQVPCPSLHKVGILSALT